MRHRKAGRKLGRNSAQRKSLFRNQSTSLLKHGVIKTTLAKAKELRRHVEPVITLGKNHAWSKYEPLVSEMNDALTALGKLDVAEEALATVVDSQSKVQNRFPSGLGALLKALNGLDAAKEQLEVLHRVRTAQMARQQALGQASSMITESDVVEKLFGELAEAFVSRNGGYTRVVKAGYREGDNAPMAYIALVLDSPVVTSDDSSDSEEAAE
jgi:ribosomal protein L17